MSTARLSTLERAALAAIPQRDHVTPSQVASAVGSTTKTERIRLERLTRRGFVARQVFAAGSQARIAYRLTGKGLDAVIAPGVPDEALEARFWAKVREVDGCWEWQGAKNQAGYGQLSVSATRKLAHRVAYELMVATIPEGLVLDHLCRNPACVNPWHLEPVTARENIIRGTVAQVMRDRADAMTHCINGHERNEENVHVTGKGYRVCRPCSREGLRRRRRALREQVSS